MTRRLYTFRISEDAVQNEETREQNALNQLPGVDGSSSVASTGGEPGDLSLRGQLRGDLAELLGTELRELLSSGPIEYLEHYAIERVTPDAGYYAVDGNRGGRVQPQAPGVVRFDFDLVREGTRETHRRQVTTNPTQRPHQWGTATDAVVGAPASARRVSWVDADGTQRAAASPSTTLSAELGDVDQYRADNAPYTSPRLVYDLPYDEAGNVDAVVFDTWNNAETDADGRFQWQQTYSPLHEYRGDIVIENGLVRVTINPTPDPHGLSAETYAGGSWSDTTLGTSDWRLAEIDLRRIAPTAVRARTEWVDTAGSAEHTLDMVLPRGFDAVQFFEPTDGSGTQIQASQAPQGLVDYLDPIASSNRIDPDGQQGLIERAKLPV